jgi:hypothetical protein
LTQLLKDNKEISEESILEFLTLPDHSSKITDTKVDSIDLNIYDELVSGAAS